MTDTYNDTTGSRKKFLIPLVVLLLCAVSLTGAGYAYNASVTNINNGAVAEGTTIGLFNEAGTAEIAVPVVTLDVAYGSHSINGKAIKYTDAAATGAKGFTNASSVVDATPNYANLASYADGYYVETAYNTTGAGYHPVAAAEDIDTTEELNDLAVAQETKGVVKLGTYQLKVGNATGGDVNVSFEADFVPNAIDLGDGVRDVIVSITGTSNNVDVDTLVSLKAGDASAADFATLAGTDVSVIFTVTVFIIVSDYYSASLPALENTDAKFTMIFGTTVA